MIAQQKVQYSRVAYLRDLLHGLMDNEKLVPDESNKAVLGITLDSRHLQPGELFIAIPGELTDGRRFAQGAIDDKAAAVAYAEAHGIEAVVQEPKTRKANIRKGGYGENFATNRRGAWTH